MFFHVLFALHMAQAPQERVFPRQAWRDSAALEVLAQEASRRLDEEELLAQVTPTPSPSTSPRSNKDPFVDKTNQSGGKVIYGPARPRKAPLPAPQRPKLKPLKVDGGPTYPKAKTPPKKD